MANTKSAKKSVKTNERNRVRNLDTRTAIKTAFKKAGQAIKTKTDDAGSAVAAAASIIDKAVVRGIIHANTAARKKSRLAKKANAAVKA